MEIMKLEDLTLIKTGISLWMRDENRIFMNKQRNGLIKLEKALQLVKRRVSHLSISHNLRNRLMCVVERTGYELYLFLNKSIMKEDFQLINIKWSVEGLINEQGSLRACLENICKYDIADFKNCCDVCDETMAKKIWGQFTDKEKEYCRTKFRYLPIPSYWIHEIESSLLVFINTFASSIIGFDVSRDLNVNMLWHSIAICNKNSILYFYQKLTVNNLTLTHLDSDKKIAHDILNWALDTNRTEYFKFIASFLEKPIVPGKCVTSIMDKLSHTNIKYFLEYILRQVNVFGDLHYNIFCFLLSQVDRTCAKAVARDLDFYALTLISKGKLEKFEFLTHMNAKKILLQQILHRLRHSRGLAIFSTIHLNGNTELLNIFLDWLADSDDDKLYFKLSLGSIIDGTQYDLTCT